MPAKSEIFKQISNAYLVRDLTGTFGNTTLNANAAAGSGTISVAAIANFAVGDLIRIGSGEEMELIQVHGSTAPTGNTITLATSTVYAHVSGEAVVEQAAYDLGDITDGGVEISYSGESLDVYVATKRLVFAVLNGYVSAQAKFALPGMSLYNFAHATGSLLALVAGSGTTASPRQFVSDGSDFAGDTNMSLVLVGTRMDGTVIRSELWGVDADYTGIQLTLARGALSPVPCTFTASAGGLMAIGAPAWTGVTTYKPTKADLFDALTSVGFFTDAASPAATTVSSGGAAGASTCVVASGSGLAAGDWIRFGTGDTMEIWQAESVVTNTITIRGKFYRAQASGTAVKKQDQTAVSGVAEGGVNLNIGGAVTQLKSALKRSLIGTRPGTATVSVTVPMIAMNLSNFARALGIPQSAIVSNRLPINAANLASDTTLNGIYLTGTLLSGSVLTALLWGTSVDLASVATTFNNNGPAGVVPITAKPASGLALLTV